MRGLAASVVVALSICGAALGAGWGIQAVVLPPAARADRVAAAASAWFLRYRVTESSLSVEGRRETGVCVRGWFTLPNGRPARGVVLALGDGTRIAYTVGGGLTVARPLGRRRWRFPALVLELAGCPLLLGKRIGGAAVDGTVSITRAYAAGRPALALRLAARPAPRRRDRLRLGRIVVYVSARTDRPLAVFGALGTVTGNARIRFAAAAPRLPARAGTSELPAPERAR